MVGVELVSSTRPKRVDAPTPSDAQWCKTTSDWPLPGRFAFFVFRVYVPYSCDGYFPGLELHVFENGYYVGGTVDDWDSACYALLNPDSPKDCVDIYRKVYETLSAIGWKLRGKRTTGLKGFYLK